MKTIITTIKSTQRVVLITIALMVTAITSAQDLIGMDGYNEIQFPDTFLHYGNQEFQNYITSTDTYEYGIEGDFDGKASQDEIEKVLSEIKRVLELNGYATDMTPSSYVVLDYINGTSGVESYDLIYEMEDENRTMFIQFHDGMCSFILSPTID